MKQRNKDQALDTSPLFYTWSKSRNIQSWRDAERSGWQGAAAQLLPSSGAHPKKPLSLPYVRSHSSKARGQGPAMPPRLGTLLRVWCHRVDTRHLHLHEPLVPFPGGETKLGSTAPPDCTEHQRVFCPTPTTPSLPKSCPLSGSPTQPSVLCLPPPTHQPHCCTPPALATPKL